MYSLVNFNKGRITPGALLILLPLPVVVFCTSLIVAARKIHQVISPDKR